MFRCNDKFIKNVSNPIHSFMQISVEEKFSRSNYHGSNDYFLSFAFVARNPIFSVDALLLNVVLINIHSCKRNPGKRENMNFDNFHPRIPLLLVLLFLKNDEDPVTS